MPHPLAVSPKFSMPQASRSTSTRLTAPPTTIHLVRFSVLLGRLLDRCLTHLLTPCLTPPPPHAQASPSTSTRLIVLPTTMTVWVWHHWRMWCVATSVKCPSQPTHSTQHTPSRQPATVRQQEGGGVKTVSAAAVFYFGGCGRREAPEGRGGESE